MYQYRSNISSDELSQLPVAGFDGQVEIIDSLSKLNDACNFLLDCPLIGFDTETKPSFQAGVTNKVALLQLCGGGRCFLFRLCRMRFDKQIIKILESNQIAKIGVDVKGDISGLQKLRHFRPDGFVELQQMVHRFGIEEQSLRKISAIVTGRSVSKAQRLSNWEAHTLTPQQIRYAATDAWVCLDIFNRLSANDKTDLPQTR